MHFAHALVWLIDYCGVFNFEGLKFRGHKKLKECVDLYFQGSEQYLYLVQ